MMKNTSTRFITVLCFLAVFCTINANVYAQRVRLSTGLGLSAYLGDLVQGAPVFQQTSPAISLGVSYDILEQLRGRINFTHLGIQGDDKYASRKDLRDRNLSFKSNVFEVAFLAEYDFVNNTEYSIVPYVFAGPGIFKFNPTTIDANGEKVKLQPLGTEGQNLPSGLYDDRKYKLTQMNFQYGLGIKYEISETISIGTEFSFRNTFTDYLDDVSTTYIAPQEFINAGQTQALLLNYRQYEIDGKPVNFSQPRGNPKKKDFFYTFQIRAMFRLDAIQLGRDLDFYSSPGRSYKYKNKVRNPKNIF